MSNPLDDYQINKHKDTPGPMNIAWGCANCGFVEAVRITTDQYDNQQSKKCRCGALISAQSADPESKQNLFAYENAQHNRDYVEVPTEYHPYFKLQPVKIQ